jgi:hypothetical protein
MKARSLIVSLIFIVFLASCKDEKVSEMFDTYEQWGGHIRDVKKVAVLGFYAEDGTLIDDITLSMVRHLRLSGYLNVMDSREAQQILAEQGMDLGGALQNGGEGAIAEGLKVDALIYGSVDAAFTSPVRYKEVVYPAYYGVLCRRPFLYYRNVQPIAYLHREGHVTIGVRMYDRKLGREAGVLELTRAYNRDFDNFYYRGVRPDGVYWFDYQKTQPMLSDQEMIACMADRLLDSMIKTFLPSYIMTIRTLQDDGRGAALAREGKWKEARAAWEHESPGHKDWKCCANLGICCEREGDPAGALAWYQKALEIDDDNEELGNYAADVRETVRMLKMTAPLDLPAGAFNCRIAEVKPDGRIYITAGEGEGIRAGDRFLVARYRLEFDQDLINPVGGHYNPLCTVVIEKVFKGVSQGRQSSDPNSSMPRNGDPASKIP